MCSRSQFIRIDLFHPPWMDLYTNFFIFGKFFFILKFPKFSIPGICINCPLSPQWLSDSHSISGGEVDRGSVEKWEFEFPIRIRPAATTTGTLVRRNYDHSLTDGTSSSPGCWKPLGFPAYIQRENSFLTVLALANVHSPIFIGKKQNRPQEDT